MNEIFSPTSQLKISLTPDCNNNCRICLNETTRSTNGQKDKLSEDTICTLIDQGAELNMVGTYFTGGEPLLEYENLLYLLRYSRQKGMIPTVVTNGGPIGAHQRYEDLNAELFQRAGLYNLDAAYIARSLKKAGLKRIYFSIDSNHTTMAKATSEVRDSVPTEVAAKNVDAFLDEGFGTVHKKEAIGHQLRITATSSGSFKKTTINVVEDVIKKAGLSLKKKISPEVKIYGDERGEVLVKHLAISNIGAAATLDDKFLENATGPELFNIKCPHFRPRQMGYDGGDHHRDLFVDHDGIVYTCGNHAYAIGNIYAEALNTIVKGTDNPGSERKQFARNRRVFRSLLHLSECQNIGERAVGEALKLASDRCPDLLWSLKTQCGACNALGNDQNLQEAFLREFRKNFNSCDA